MDWAENADRCGKRDARQQSSTEARYARDSKYSPTTAVKFKKAPNGTWLVHGPASMVKLGPVAVHRKDGSIENVIVTKVMPGKYGYLGVFVRGKTS